MTEPKPNQSNKKQFFITIKSGLLEGKHREAMQINQKTTAVWMYLWFIDKITSIDADSKLGVVLYGKPLKIDGLAKELFTSRNTANKMLQALKKHGYIETIKTPHGQIVYVTKAFKIFGQKVPSDNKLEFVETYGSDHPGSTTAMSKSNTPVKESNTPHSNNLIHHYEQGLPLKESNTPNITRQLQDSTYNNSTNVELGDKKSPAKNPHKELVSKLYYEAIKSLDLPVRNHNNVKSKISEMARDKDQTKIINYLTFMRDQYSAVEWEYKPHVSEALDIFNKRGTIRDTFKKHLKTDADSKPLRFGSKK